MRPEYAWDEEDNRNVRRALEEGLESNDSSEASTEDLLNALTENTDSD